MKVVLTLLITVNLVYGKQRSDDVLQLIKRAGYVGEAHQVETEDGYLLKVHRILPRGGSTSRFPAFLMHGLIATSADFVITGPKIALAYYLADNGYDVWMGNARGNKHSTNHTRLSTDSRAFWTFSWHEIGFYDLPAMIDFVLMKTGSSKTFYVGHSQGTTSLLVFLSTHPEYNQKIVQAHLLSPAAFMAHIPHPLTSSLAMTIKNGFFRDYRYISLASILNLGNGLAKVLCTERSRLTLAFCQSVILGIVGPNKHALELDNNILPTLVQHVSSRFSVMQLVHYFQSYFSKRFQTFDHRWKNYEHYNSSTPIDYPVEKIVAPVYIYIATEDALVSRFDVEHLADLLPNVRRFQVIKNWNHIDFTYGRNTRKVLYKGILQDFKSENQKNWF